jgi:hypothetical protein
MSYILKKMSKISVYLFKNLFEEDLIPINKKNSEKIKVNGKDPSTI